MVPIKKSYIPVGHPNRPAKRIIDLRAIVVHYTANDRPGADDEFTARYFGRPWKIKGAEIYEANGTTPFRYGSAQVIADADSIVETMPLDYVAWGCGDRHLPRNNGADGQSLLARDVLDGRPNYHTLNIEICNNDTIPNSDEDWWHACGNAADWITNHLIRQDLTIDLPHSILPQTCTTKVQPGKVLLLRHYDITGKACPRPFIGEHQVDWESFVQDIERGVRDRRIP